MHSNDQNAPRPNKVSYLTAIRAWARTRDHGAPIKAQALLRRMEDLSMDGRPELKPCVVVYSALIDVWSKSGRLDATERSLDLFYEMQALSASGRKEAKPNTVTLNSVLDAFARQGSAEEAHALLKNLSTSSSSQDDIKPDIISYTTVLKAYSKSTASNAAECASEMLLELEQQFHNGEWSLKPTVQTYTLTILAWGNSGRPDAAEQAEKVFWKMLDLYNLGDEDIKPNVITLNCVLRAWCNSREGGAAERAEAVFHWMNTEGAALSIIPDATSYLHMMYAWAHSGRRQAYRKAQTHLNSLKEISFKEQSKVMLTTAHFNTLILASSKSRELNFLQKIEGTVKEMIALAKLGHAVAPDVTTLNHYVRAVAASDVPDRFTKAQAMVAKMKKSGVEPNSTTAKMLQRSLSHECSTGQ
jgi:pentatricopeptide repeat protein